MAPRTHAVQTPGAPAPAADTQAQNPTGAEAQAAQPVETPEVAPKPARQTRKAPAPAGRMACRDIPADQIDPSTLRAPVLSRDGWVCPSKAPTDPREGA
ncbi:hypothetical protein ABRZ04_05250 [Castellaniella ginsengisoli]|uniref:Uncharacterized protein n=1 Tax=Castellaniella ginsengisoli TaxID=546114 RepID=A0AB39D2G2_9BURK